MILSDYIYFTQQHLMADEDFEYNLMSIISQTKSQIIDNALKEHQKRIQNLQTSAALSDSEKLMLEDLFLRETSWTKEINTNNVNPNAKMFSEAAFPDLHQQMIYFQQQTEDRSFTIKEFQKNLTKLINLIEQTYEPMLKDYTASVIGKFTNGKGHKNVGSTAAKKKTTSVEGRILETLRGSYSGDAFRVSNKDVLSNNAKDRLSVSIGKLAVLKQMLNSKKGRSYISSLDKNDRNDFWDSVIANSNSWIKEIIALVGEIGALDCIKQSGELGSEVFSDFNKFVHDNLKSTHRESMNTGNAGIIMDGKFKEDPRLEKEFKKMVEVYGEKQGTPFSSFNSFGSKADLVINRSKDNITASIGISIKDYQANIKIDGFLDKVGFTTQNSSTLLTLMLREANMSYSDVLTYINVGAATPNRADLRGQDAQYDARLENYWARFKEIVTYSSLYSTLAGLGGKNQEVYFLGINNKVIPITDILLQFRETVDKGSRFSLLKSSGNGFNRNFFQEVNKKAFIEGPRSRIGYGEERSEDVRGKLMRELQQTRISTYIDIVGLSQLV